MKDDRLFGALSILASLLPLWVAMGLALGFGLGLSDWLVMLYAIPGTMALGAGISLLMRHRQRYLWGITAWLLLAISALLTLAISWWSFAPGTQLPIGVLLVEALYMGVGIAMVLSLHRRRRRKECKPDGGTIAA